MANKPWHKDPRYVKASRALRTAAALNPTTVCWRCGKTLGQHRTRTGKPDRWQAGHTRQGSTTWQVWTQLDRVPTGGDWLAPEARSCNAADGARIRNALSSTGFDWP